MNYKEIARIATALEQQVLGKEAFVDGLNERIKEEKKESDKLPETSLEASESCNKKVASLKKLTRLAHQVRNSGMTDSEKRMAMQKIAKMRVAIDEEKIIDKSQLVKQGPNKAKIREIYQQMELLNEVQKNTRLSDLNVTVKTPVNQLTIQGIINILDIIAKNLAIQNKNTIQNNQNVPDINNLDVNEN